MGRSDCVRCHHLYALTCSDIKRSEIKSKMKGFLCLSKQFTKGPCSSSPWRADLWRCQRLLDICIGLSWISDNRRRGSPLRHSFSVSYLTQPWKGMTQAVEELKASTFGLGGTAAALHSGCGSSETNNVIPAGHFVDTAQERARTIKRPPPQRQRSILNAPPQFHCSISHAFLYFSRFLVYLTEDGNAYRFGMTGG